MRVLVTGPGKLGRPLLERLERQGVTGKVLHRNPTAPLPAGWQAVRADLTLPDSLVDACKECDQVLHLAAVTHSNRAARYDEVNAVGTSNLIAEARRSGVARFTFVSTRAISSEGGAYSRSKIAAEKIVRESSLAWSILRPAEVYGTGGEGISALIERSRAGRWIPLVGDGGARLAPIYLDDVVEGICRAVMAQGSGTVLDLAGPEEMTQRQLIDRLGSYFQTRPFTVRVPAGLLDLAARSMALVGLKRPPIYADQVARLLSAKRHDIEGAIRELGFRARPLEEGLDALFRRGPRSPA
ncbi:MAG TPA: NAD-dependent epimerase/dehydratase family protein [Thermoanaerobaculia bacterium]|nr:NAD-dependent epimerase/dehydratase family protein [Thermoanaerobaculia bacterium]